MDNVMPRIVSLPSRGAWIEIFGMLDYTSDLYTSLPSRGAWIEIEKVKY